MKAKSRPRRITEVVFFSIVVLVSACEDHAPSGACTDNEPPPDTACADAFTSALCNQVDGNFHPGVRCSALGLG